MDISFVSSLDAQEEERIASILMAAVGALLDHSAFPYTVRIKTSGQKLFQRSHPGALHNADGAALGASRVAHSGRSPFTE